MSPIDTQPYLCNHRDLFTRVVTFSPKFLLALLILPVLGGLLGVLLPAFGWTPALKQNAIGLQGFQALWQTPGLVKMMTVSLTTGFISTLFAVILTFMILAAFFNSPWLNRIQR